MSKIARVIYDAQRDQEPISASVRLKKNGRFSSVSGRVENLKVSRDGFPYATIKKGKNEYQNVRLDNILSVAKGDWIYSRY